MDELQNAEKLAMLVLKDGERQYARQSLNRLDEWAERLPEREEDFGCMCHQPLKLREDRIQPSLELETLLALSPRKKADYILCPAAFAGDED